MENRKLLFLTGFHVLLAGLVAFFILSCTSTPKANVRPAGCEQSVIYDHIPYPEVVSSIQILAVAEVGVKHPEIKPFLQRFSSDAVTALQDENLTYLGLGRLIVDQTDWANGYVGQRVLLCSEIFAPFDQEIPISACDRAFLVRHFQRQIKALESVASDQWLVDRR